MIALPYGPGTDWIKNVLATGSATIVNEGETWLIDRPELVPVDVAAPYMPAKEQRELRRFAIDRCLRVHRVDTADTMADPSGDDAVCARVTDSSRSASKVPRGAFSGLGTAEGPVRRPALVR